MIEEIKRLKALAETGLLYCRNEYDIERYQEIQAIALRLMSELSDHSVEDIRIALPMSPEYPTAKVDIRCLIIGEHNKILFAKESADGRWSLPGGWADIGYSPKENAVKECKEETGLDVEPVALLAVFDKKMHNHPPEAFYVYKLVILCKAISTQLSKGFDVLDLGYFGIDELPELSEDRILKSQIETVYRKALERNFIAEFD